MPRKQERTVEVVTIGNEILIGQTLDTNSNWIAKQVTRLGWTLQRVTQIRDSLDSIKHGIKEALDRKPTLLITVGGLGPTHDDMTLKGVARALGRPTFVNQNALEMIRRHYAGMEKPLALTSSRRKMATLPKGSEPLPNPIGTAPGVMTKSGLTRILSLPGVPTEMKAIFKRWVLPILKASRLDPPQEAQLLVTGIIESALAPVLRQAQRKYRGLYFKSHPRGRETGVRPLIQLHIYSTDKKSVGKIQDSVAFLVERLSKTAV